MPVSRSNTAPTSPPVCTAASSCGSTPCHPGQPGWQQPHHAQQQRQQQQRQQQLLLQAGPLVGCCQQRVLLLLQPGVLPLPLLLLLSLLLQAPAPAAAGAQHQPGCTPVQTATTTTERMHFVCEPATGANSCQHSMFTQLAPCLMPPPLCDNNTHWYLPGDLSGPQANTSTC